MPIDMDSARVLKIMSGGKRVADCQLKSTSPYARKYDTVREPYDTVRATYEQRYEKRLRTPYEPRLRYRTNKGYEPKDEPPLREACHSDHMKHAPRFNVLGHAPQPGWCRKGRAGPERNLDSRLNPQFSMVGRQPHPDHNLAPYVLSGRPHHLATALPRAA